MTPDQYCEFLTALLHKNCADSGFDMNTVQVGTNE